MHWTPEFRTGLRMHQRKRLLPLVLTAEDLTLPPDDSSIFIEMELDSPLPAPTPQPLDFEAETGFRSGKSGFRGPSAGKSTKKRTKSGIATIPA